MNEEVVGEVEVHVFVIEFSKSGLAHTHGFFFFSESSEAHFYNGFQ